MSCMSSLVLLLLALVCMPGFTEPWHHPKKAHKVPRAVKAGDQSNSNSLERSTEEDAVHAESRLKTRDVYHGLTVCQLIRKVTFSAECLGQGSGPWRSLFWSRKRCRGILRFLKKIARLLDVSCDLTATTVESQSPTTTPAPTTTQGGKCLNTPKQRSVHCLYYRELVGQ